MELTLTFIRNAFTLGGKEGRFVGLTDRPLHPEGEALLRSRAERGDYPEADIVFSSPMLRCVESARIIYPDSEPVVIEQLSALDYGEFSNRTYSEIVADKRFAEWAKADRLLACPGGEEPHVFTSRCGAALREIIDQSTDMGLGRVSVICHLPVIQTIMRRHCLPRLPFRDWHVEYGGGFITRNVARKADLKEIGKF